jgi:uncharacterized surface protein with fasciclin (FAS1) repeats
MKKILAFSLIALALGTAQAVKRTIVDVAVSDPQFSTLVTALKAAGLVDTLAGKGPFTVFAPTNAAFAKIPKGDLEKLLADKAALTKVLTYHVVSGKVTAAKVMKMKSAKTLEGGNLNIAVMGKTVEINGAKVIKANVLASNGVVHVIDTVLMPKM